MKRVLDRGLVIPIGLFLPIAALKTVRLRLFRWDTDASDRRIGVTVQVEW